MYVLLYFFHIKITKYYYCIILEKATSELLPANQEDVALQFMISDQIRSKKVNAKDAMRCLHKRLQHKNPNVQMATLSVRYFFYVYTHVHQRKKKENSHIQ